MSGVHDALCAYAHAVRQDRRANQGLPRDGTALELLLAPRFQQLIEALLAQLMPQAPRVLPEYRTPGIGRPDLAFKREGAPARAFIELKQPDTSLDPKRLRGHDQDQFRRFRELPTWAFCNFHRMHLYKAGRMVEEAVILPATALDPQTDDATASRLITRQETAGFIAILEALALAQVMRPRDALGVAESLARAARLVRQVVTDQCRAGAPQALATARDEFRETLFAHAAAGGYDVADEDVLFGNAFAQTLAFGLLLARESAGADVDRDAYRKLPEGSYPLLRVTLRVLTQDEILDVLGVAFDVILDVVNAVDTALLAVQRGRDPILYFYEDFLQIFDPEARKRHGVFFTPVPVVQYMVAATERALSEGLGTGGLLDPDVVLLDPACGTGTFLIAAAASGAQRALERYGEGAVAGEMAALAGRLGGFELLVGPYTVAHYRMLREVARHHVVPARRLPIFLADTLANSAEARAVNTRLGFMSTPIVEERRGADTLKQRTRVLAIIGNPPYRRLSEGEDRTVFSGWDPPLWNDLKQAVSNAGWGGELNTFPELSVAFWRWCIWKLFESDDAPGRGVVCLITNRTFLAGHPYVGLRQSMRRHFDSIDIIDLRGDSRGARPAGIEHDQNIFDVQVGVCIVLALTKGRQSASRHSAIVRYADVWKQDAFSAGRKLALLTEATLGGPSFDFIKVVRPDLADFLPAAFANEDWLSLVDVFGWHKSGSKSQRDDLVYGFSAERVLGQINDFRTQSEDEAWKAFYPKSTPEEARSGLVRSAIKDAALRTKRKRFDASRASVPSATLIERRVYRPLDCRFLYATSGFVSRHGPDLGAAWGSENVCLYAMPAGTGAGPAVWAHASMPDYHAFRGSYGGYAFPLWDRRQGQGAHNINPVLIDGLATAYGAMPAPQTVFDAVAALLSATSYTSRFASDLEESFAHIPFPADPGTFAEAARIGAEIRALECFERPPGPAFETARLAGRASGLTLEVPRLRDAFIEDGSGRGAVPLLADQSLRLTGVGARAWSFGVSGYRVIHRWLDARKGEVIDAALQREVIDLARRTEELLHWFDAADAVLAAAVARPLTRTVLGLSPLAPDCERG